jgi:hypothetical protein
MWLIGEKRPRRSSDESKTAHPRLSVPALAFVGVSVALLSLWVTGGGPGVSHDSTVYIDAAESLLAGTGFRARGRPLAAYPPGYPALLALSSTIGHGDVLEGARLLNAVLLGVSVILIGLPVSMCTRGSLLATACAMLIFLSSPPVLYVYSMAWSEPPFIVFTLATVGLLSLHVVHPRRGVLLSASASFGLALAMRYAGIALVPALIAAVLGVGGRSMKDKIRDAFVATLVGCAPLGAWLIRNLATAETATGRRFAIHPAGMDHVKALCSTLLTFVSPDSGSARAKILQLLLLTAGAAVFAAALHGRDQTRNGAARSCATFCSISLLFASTYVAALFICISFFSMSTPLDARILLPVFALLVAPVTSLAWSLPRAFDSRIVRWGVFSIASLLVIFNGERAVAEAVDLHANGRGYTSVKWRSSPSIRWVRALTSDRKIFSNGPDVIRFLTGKEAAPIPTDTARTGAPREGYEDELRSMCDACRHGDALVVYFEELVVWPYPTRQQLTSKCDLPVLGELDDGTIYGRR